LSDFGGLGSSRRFSLKREGSGANMMYTLRFDGLFRSLPGGVRPEQKAGFMGYGWLIFHNERVVAHGHGVYGHGQNATSNTAEYLALIEGLEALQDMGIHTEPVQVIGDAKCVIEQMQGLAGINSPDVRDLYRRAHRLAGHFTHLEWQWKPREENRDADSLTRRAIRQVRFDRSAYQEAIQALNPALQREADRRNYLLLLDLRVYRPQGKKPDGHAFSKAHLSRGAVPARAK
jgi:ribonuclease HI